MKGISRYFILLMVCFSGFAVEAQQASPNETQAEKAAKQILVLFSEGEFSKVWDSMASEWAHKTYNRDVFLANFAIGRPKLGKLISTTPIMRTHFTDDQNLNFHGDGYNITFKSTYTTGEFFEVVGVVKDSDGQYRLTGIDGAPVPH